MSNPGTFSRVTGWMLRGGVGVLLVFIAACNAMLGIDEVTLETPTGPLSADAGIDARRCDVASSFTLLAATPATSVLTHHMSGGGASLLFLLNNDPNPDALAMDLYDSMGGHGIVNAVGSYDLTASDAALVSCALCVGIYTDFDSSSSTFSQTYFAAAQGTVKINTYDATGISGSLKSLRLRQVEFSGNRTQDIAGGCTVTIGDAEFTAKWSSGAVLSTRSLDMITPHRLIHAE